MRALERNPVFHGTVNGFETTITLDSAPRLRDNRIENLAGTLTYVAGTYTAGRSFNLTETERGSDLFRQMWSEEEAGKMSLNLFVPINLAGTACDSIQAWVTPRDSFPEDPKLSEAADQTASLSFNGDVDGIKMNVQVTGLWTDSGFVTPADGTVVLDPSHTDKLRANVTYTLDSGATMAFSDQEFTETGLNTRVFRTTVSLSGSDGGVVTGDGGGVVSWVTTVGESNTENVNTYIPVTIRVKGLPTIQGDARDDFNVSLCGVDYQLIKANSEDEYWYLKSGDSLTVGSPNQKLDPNVGDIDEENVTMLLPAPEQGVATNTFGFAPENMPKAVLKDANRNANILEKALLVAKAEFLLLDGAPESRLLTTVPSHILNTVLESDGYEFDDEWSFKLCFRNIPDDAALETVIHAYDIDGTLLEEHTVELERDAQNRLVSKKRIIFYHGELDDDVKESLQGHKVGHLGNRKFQYDANHYLVTSVTMPFECETFATPDDPVRGLYIDLDLGILRDLIGRLDIPFEVGKNNDKNLPLGIGPAIIDNEMREVLSRLLKCLQSESDTEILGPGIVREIMYRALLGDQGGLLYSLATHGGNFSQVARALKVIQSEYADDLDVELLASTAHMSVSAFHRAFKDMTSDSPIQYLKKIRLTRARDMMLQDNVKAYMAADKVGYESASQFSREFKRHFGQTPAEMMREMRA